MGAQHTPGPWFLQPAFGSIYALSGGTSGLTIFVAKAEGHQCGEEQAEANTRLIAAAPDLLEFARWASVLEAAQNPKRQLAEIAKAARTLIAKTERAA